MKEPKANVSIWFDFLVMIITFVIYVKFPDAPPYITVLPGIGAILLSIVIYLISNHFYKKHIVIVKKYQESINNLNKEIRLKNATLSKYDDLFEKIIQVYLECSITVRDEKEKKIFTKLYKHVNDSYLRLLITTNRKKVNVHEDEDSEDY